MHFNKLCLFKSCLKVTLQFKTTKYGFEGIKWHLLGFIYLALIRIMLGNLSVYWLYANITSAARHLINLTGEIQEQIIRLRANQAAALGFPRSSYPKVCWDFLQTLSLKRCWSGNERLISYTSCLSSSIEDTQSIVRLTYITVTQTKSWFDSFCCQISNLAEWHVTKCPINRDN